MGKNTSILLGDYFESFVNEKISSGKYSSVSEVIRNALRLMESEENKTKIEDVEYANGNLYIFRREYDKKADEMTLFFQTVSS